MLFVTSVLLLLPAEDCRSPSGCTRTESLATTVTDLQVTLIGIQDWDQEGNTLCSGKTGRTGIQIDLFRRKCYEINVLHLSILRKALESLTEKAMAPHSSTLPWKIPWMEKPGGLQSMGSQRVRHDWTTSLWLFTFLHWRRKWQPTPVFLPGESQGRGSLVGCHLWGCTESDTTEVI